MRKTVLVSLLLAALAAPASARAPYQAIEQLRRLCIATKADPVAVRKAALAAGFRPSRTDPLGLDLGDQSASVYVRAASSTADDPELGPVIVDGCQIIMFPGASQLPEVLRWAGVAGAGAGGTFVIVESPKGNRRISGVDGPAKRAALAQGTLRTFKVEPITDDGIMMFYLVPRPGLARSAPASATVEEGPSPGARRWAASASH